MPVNFNTLQPIVPPSVVAQLPQQPNQANQFAGGMMSGILQGQQIQSNQLALQQQQQAASDNKALRAAPNEDVWLQTLQSQGKYDLALSYKTQQLQYQTALLNNKSSVLDLNAKEREKADRDNAINVSVMGQVSSLPPEQQVSEYNRYRADLMEKYPDLVMPKEFNANTMASVMRTNQIMQSTMQQKDTEKVATLVQLENRLNNLSATKAQYEKNGTPTARLEEQIKNTQNLINTHTKNVQTQKQEAYQGKLDEELGKQDAAIAKNASDTRDKMISFRDFNEQAMKQLKSVPGYAVGPIVSAIKLDKLNPQAQILSGYLSASTLLAKDILGLKGGTQGFTEGERKFVQEVAGGTFQNKYSLEQLTSNMNRLARKVEYREWKKEQGIRKSSGNYDKWAEANPEPSAMIKLPNGQTGKIPYSQLQEAIKRGAKEV